MAAGAWMAATTSASPIVSNPHVAASSYRWTGLFSVVLPPLWDQLCCRLGHPLSSLTHTLVAVAPVHLLQHGH